MGAEAAEPSESLDRAKLAELAARAEDAVAMARAAGADDAWASASRGRGVEVALRDGAIEKLEESTSRGLSLRLYVDGRYGTYRTSDLRPDPLRAFVREAVATTRALERDPFRAIPDPSLFRDRPSVDLELADRRVLDIDTDSLVGWCRAIDARCVHERRLSVTSGASLGHSLVASVSSNGFSGSHERTSHWRGASVTLRDAGDARPSGAFWAGARHLADVVDPDAVGDEALRQAARRLGARKGETRRGVMVVEPRAAGRLVGLLLGPAHAASFAQERSFWRTRMKTPAVSERLSITDDPLIVRGFGSRTYDGEGIGARVLPILERGALVNAYVDTYHGRKVGMPPTTGGASNLVVDPGARDLAAIVSDVHDGLLVTSWLGGNSDATTGDFSLGLRGHVIANGAIGAPVQGMNLTGNLLSLFAQLVEVGGDPWTYGSRLVPTLVFDPVQVGGV